MLRRMVPGAVAVLAVGRLLGDLSVVYFFSCGIGAAGVASNPINAFASL
jgi:hypothetical protein